MIWPPSKLFLWNIVYNIFYSWYSGDLKDPYHTIIMITDLAGITLKIWTFLLKARISLGRRWRLSLVHRRKGYCDYKASTLYAVNGKQNPQKHHLWLSLEQRLCIMRVLSVLMRMHTCMTFPHFCSEPTLFSFYYNGKRVVGTIG